MRYETPGDGTSEVEVTNVSQHGFWLLIRDEEVFLPFETFPWFRNAPIGKIIRVELSSEEHLYWPELDVDLEMDALYHPEKYPLVSKVLEASEDYLPGNQPGPELKKIEASVLALLQLTLHDERCAWKGLAFEVMDSLFEKGYILDPRNRTKSVVLTDKGLARSRELFEELYGKQ